MKFPQVSICIPCYNFPRGVKRALESIKSQSFHDYEIILTDDSSTDEVSQVAKDFSHLLPLFYFKNKRSLGSPGNWNEAIRRSSGRLIKFLHHDDWFSTSNSLKNYVDLMASPHEPSLGFSACHNFNDQTNALSLHQPTPRMLARLGQNPALLLWGNFIGAPSTTIFWKSSNCFFDERLKWLVDIDFFIRILQTQPKFEFCPAPLVTVTFNGQHQITNLCANNPQVEIRESLLIYEKLKSLKIRYLKFLFKLFCRFPLQTPPKIFNLAPRKTWPMVSLSLLARFLFIWEQRLRRFHYNHLKLHPAT